MRFLNSKSDLKYYVLLTCIPLRLYFHILNCTCFNNLYVCIKNIYGWNENLNKNQKKICCCYICCCVYVCCCFIIIIVVVVIFKTECIYIMYVCMYVCMLVLVKFLSLKADLNVNVYMHVNVYIYICTFRSETVPMTK